VLRHHMSSSVAVAVGHVVVDDDRSKHLLVVVARAVLIIWRALVQDSNEIAIKFF
jgi:hypothetical protein